MNKSTGKFMKIGILTILDVANFGSALQAFALAKVIQKKGYEPIFINYWRSDYTTSNKIKTFFRDKSLGTIFHRIFFILATIVLYNPVRNKIRRFVTDKFKFTKKYTSDTELINNPPDIDIAVLGSDQVWNCVYNNGLDKAFFLNFTDKLKYAYAASMGTDSFPKEQLPEVIELLHGFRKISIRETQTTEYIKSLGFNNVCQVLDPSLLLNKIQWLNTISKNKQPTERYLLVYSVERFNNDFIFSQAKKLANELNLKIYVICSTYPLKANKYRFDKIFFMAGVDTFLNLFAHAQFIVASSFHGTAFAINFNKEFVTISANKYNIRMKSLTQMFGLEKRVINNEMISVHSLEKIDWDIVNGKLEQERLNSFSFIDSILSPQK